jgi:hypothetical protein
MQPEHGGLLNGNVAAHQLRERPFSGQMEINTKRPFSGPTRTFHV